MDMKKTGQLIAETRKALGLTQKQLADQIGVTDKAVSRWETGGSVPELEKLVKLSQVFGITLDELVMGEDIPERPAPEPQVIYIEKPSTKTQKWRIALCSLLCVLLLTNLVATILLAKGEPDPQASSGPIQQVPQDFEIAASEVGGMEIEWNAGSISILAADTDKITIAAPNSAELVGDVLKILPSADSDEELVITVPRDWTCQSMKLQCNGTTVDLQQLSAETLVLNGSDCVWTVSGDIEIINIAGNRSNLDLTLPQDRGFQVELDWVHNTFHSAYSGVRFDGSKYLCGDQYCKIRVDGLSCVVFIGRSK